MIQSHVVEVNGTFVGVAIATAGAFRFRAVDIKVEELDQSTWRSLGELNRVVTHLFTTGRFGAIRAPVLIPLQSAENSLLLAAAVGASSWTG